MEQLIRKRSASLFFLAIPSVVSLGARKVGAGMPIEKKRPAAFSLIEILLVIAIMSVVMAMAFTNFNQIAESMRIGAAGQDLRGALLLARQEAISRNQPVEVRFCRQNATSPVRFIQIVAYRSDGTIKQLAGTTKLPDGISVETSVATSKPCSTIFSQPNQARLASGNAFVLNSLPLSLLGYGLSYEVFSFFMRPDGSTSLSQSGANYPFITVRSDRNAGGTPANFATVQIDPVAGHPTIFRP